MYRIEKINISNLTNHEVDELYGTYEYIVNKYKLLRRFRNSKEYTESFLQTFCDHDKVLYITRNESLICGMLQWVKSADWNGKELYKLTIYLCDSVISRALLLCLDEFIQKKTKQYGKFAIVTYNDELKNIMEDMTDAREEGYVKYIITPDKQRKFNESNKKTNITHHCYMIFNDCSEMVAKSNVSVNNNDPRFPYQFMIGVKRTYRGRNLGKWLYASMYKKLVEDVEFEKTIVYHHVENHHAINISKWIGYKFNYLETTYIVTNDHGRIE